MNRTEYLDVAAHTITKDREEEYGRPEVSFNRIADLWSAYLRTRLDAKDVALMMILLKVARAKNGAHRDDTYVDIAGYAALAGELMTTPEE